MKKSLIIAGSLLLGILCLGTIGYYGLSALALGSEAWSVSDCFYMTIITLTTVGFYCLQSGDTMIFQAELDALRKFCKKNLL